MSSLLQEQLDRCIGVALTSKTNACNSLLLNFPLATIYIDPCWRYESNNKIQIASGDFRHPDEFEFEGEYEIDFKQCCNRTHHLQGAILKRAVLLPHNDLLLEFAGAQIVRTFHGWTGNEESWHLTNYKTNVIYRVFSSKVLVVEKYD